jgi:uncharacterized membrane protein YgcG
MTRLHRWTVLLAIAGSCLLLAAQAVAVAPEIRDQAKLFSSEGIKKADERLAEIYRKHDRDLLIETFATVPADDVEKVKAMDAKERGEYSLTWAKERAQRRAVNGVYVLICKEPRILRVGITEKTPHKFPEGTQAQIENALKKELTDGHFDQALEQALKIVEERLAKAK